ncbi:MAG: hypothetical protein QOK01_1051, partial [Alphaproteobacteria bacterium]|nr:hypothetical protein [Alphaproteobacteria bacterium]
GFAVWPLQRVTLRPRGGLPMLITARNPDTRPTPGRARPAPRMRALPN